MVVPARRKAQYRNVGCWSVTAVSSLCLMATTWCLFYRSYNLPHKVWIPPNQRLRPSVEGPMMFTPQPQPALEHQHPPTQRYLIFRPPLEAAQGVGNLMNGLLAAHLLGNEFDRIVCVSNDWQDFTNAFESLDQRCFIRNLPSPSSKTTLWLLNFSKLPINECELKRRLEGPELVITLVANSYPSWSQQHEIRLESLYRPKFSLPWSHTPTTVVHLRQADNTLDPRAGLDSETLGALGVSLPPDTYLVTNQVNYYTYFESNFGWSHPLWTGIQHSAIANIRWTIDTPKSRWEQIIQLWTDWWTIYKAQTVYHTHSDFSRSATRWSQTKSSYTILGHDEHGTMTWKQDQDENVPFRQRTKLQNCELQSSGLDGVGYVLDLDDEMHDDLEDDWEKHQISYE